MWLGPGSGRTVTQSYARKPDVVACGSRVVIVLPPNDASPGLMEQMKWVNVALVLRARLGKRRSAKPERRFWSQPATPGNRRDEATRLGGILVR